MQQQIANLSAPLPGPCTPTPQCCPQGPGAHPVILRANSPATPGTIQDTLPPALPVQRIPNPHVCNASSTAVQKKSRVHPSPKMRQMLYSCGVGLLHSCFVCFITFTPQTLFCLAYLLSCRVTLATRQAQVEHQCRHLAVCTAELLEVQVPSRPLLVVHPGRPQVERHHLEAPQAPIPHRGHPLAILGPTEALLALGLLVPCIQVNLKNLFPLQQLRCCCRKGKRGWWGVHCPCLSSGTRQGRSSDPLGHCTTPP